jgi:hypothetical protein
VVIRKLFNGWCAGDLLAHTLWSLVFHPHIISLSLIHFLSVKNFTAKKQKSSKEFTNSNNFEEPIFIYFSGG